MCRENKSGARIPFSENGKSFVFLNPDRATHEAIRVDGCEITQGPRCDWALILSSGREVYIELKGVDLNHAYEQVAATVPQITRGKGVQKVFCLIASRVPREDTSGQRLRLLLKTKFDMRAIKKSRVMEVGEEELFGS